MLYFVAPPSEELKHLLALFTSCDRNNYTALLIDVAIDQITKMYTRRQIVGIYIKEPRSKLLLTFIIVLFRGLLPLMPHFLRPADWTLPSSTSFSNTAI